MSDINLTEEELGRLRLRGYQNPPFFLRTFLSDWFPDRIPWVHRGIIAIELRRADFLLEFDDDYGPEDLEKILSNFVWEIPASEDEDGNPLLQRIFHLREAEDGSEYLEMELGRNVLVMMPRGFSKTTLMNGLIVFSVCYRETDFEMLVSASQGHSTRSVSSISNQLESNPLIKLCFGDMRPPQRSGVKWSESEGELTTLHGVSLMAKGVGSQIRGSLINGKRPKRITVDDLEDRDTVNTPEQREKLKEWYFSDLKYALPRTYKEGTITVLATLLHRESLPTQLWEDPDYTTIVFGATDRQGDPLWPEAMSLEEIESDRDSMAAQGMLHKFYLELYNKIVAPEKQSFKDEFFIIEAAPRDEFAKKAIAIDPAISDQKRADFASIAMGGVRLDGRFHIQEVFLEKNVNPEKLIETYFDMAMGWGMTSADGYGVESIAYQKALLHYIRQMMFKRKFFFECEPITHGNTNKDARILGHLHGRYAARAVTHQYMMPKYKGQLLDFPNGKKDGPDAVAMMFSLLGSVMHVAGSEDGGKHYDEDEYEPIEEMIGGDWRRH